jgi:hypothetical protein
VTAGRLRSSALPGVLLAAGLWSFAWARDAERAYEIPFDFKTRQPIGSVRVNGGQAVPFLFDTGASINVLDERIAMQAGLAGENPRAISGGGQGTVQARFVDSIVLESAAIQWVDQRAAILPLGYPEAKHFAGLIGAPILMRYVVQFDFERHVLRLMAPGTYAPPAAAVRVPFELQDDLPIVRATVDTGSGPVEARLMLDTGAGGVFVDLNSPFVKAHRMLEGVEGASERARPAAIGGSAPFVYGTARRIVLGGMVFDSPRVGFSRATAGSSSRTEKDGIIGNLLMERFRVTFDYNRRMAIFESPARPPR